MNPTHYRGMLSRGMCKHVRREKARIRREARNQDEAERRIQQLMRRLHGSTSSGTTQK